MSAQIPDGSVVVTPTDMYREIRDMHDELRALNSSINPALQEIRGDVEDHETRIRTLEKFSWKQIGASSVLATVVSGAVAYLSAH